MSKTQEDSKTPLLNKILIAGLIVFAVVYAYIILGDKPLGFIIALLSIALGLAISVPLGKLLKSSMKKK